MIEHIQSDLYEWKKQPGLYREEGRIQYGKILIQDINLLQQKDKINMPFILTTIVAFF